MPWRPYIESRASTQRRAWEPSSGALTLAGKSTSMILGPVREEACEPTPALPSDRVYKLASAASGVRLVRAVDGAGNPAVFVPPIQITFRVRAVLDGEIADVEEQVVQSLSGAPGARELGRYTFHSASMAYESVQINATLESLAIGWPGTLTVELSSAWRVADGLFVPGEWTP